MSEAVKKYSEVSRRYASALFQMAEEDGDHSKIFAEIRSLESIFADGEIKEFLSSPLIAAEQKEQILDKALEGSEISASVKQFVLLLASKNRLGLFDDVVLAYQEKSDQSNGVVRGNVRSSYALGPDERKRIEEIVVKATGKSVILNYTEDSSVIGGLIAEVGSYSFDDSIDSHLRRMKEELNRRAH